MSELKTISIRLDLEMESKVSFLASQCGLSTEDMMGAIVVLDGFQKGWLTIPPTPDSTPTTLPESAAASEEP